MGTPSPLLDHRDEVEKEEAGEKAYRRGDEAGAESQTKESQAKEEGNQMMLTLGGLALVAAVIATIGSSFLFLVWWSDKIL